MKDPDNDVSPKVLLLLFCSLNILIYADRGASASNGVNALGLSKEFQLSLSEQGLLPAAFMIGLLLSSPIFAEAAKHSGAFRLIGIGMGLWSIATLGAGLAPNFVVLIICRMVVGVGEASFVALASPFIDDRAPPPQKARWLATFYLCIPVGFAVGMIWGGSITAFFSWRAAFLLESLAMVPFIVFFFRSPNIDLRGTRLEADAASSGQHHAQAETIDIEGSSVLGHRSRATPKALLREFLGDISILVESRVYVCIVIGMTSYVAVIGAYAFYGPQAGKDAFNVAPKTADYSFGAVTVISGVLGTLAGGVLLDRRGCTIRNGLIICASGLSIGSIMAIASFLLAPSFPIFCIMFGMAQAALFSTAAPSNAVAMWSVPSGLRPLAMSMSVVAMHVFGDVPSPPLMGLVQESLQDWKITMSLAAVVLLVGAVAYGVGIVASKTAIDYRTYGVVENEDAGEDIR